MGVRGAWKEFRKKHICSQASVEDSKTELCGLKLAVACGVKPVVVFDGPQIPEEKLHQRKSGGLAPLSKVLEKKLDYAKSRKYGSQNARRYRKGHTGSSELQHILEECKKVLDLMGVVYVESAGEGEAECARMETEGLVDGTLTPDSDYFLFGGRNLYEMTFKGRTYPSCKIFTLKEHGQLRMSRSELIMGAMLSGCDYTLKGVKKIGFVKAQKIIHQFRNTDHSQDHHPLSLLVRFRDHCSAAECVPRKKMSRWQKLGVSFPIGFPSSRLFDLYENPVLKTDGALSQTWSENLKPAWTEKEVSDLIGISH